LIHGDLRKFPVDRSIIEKELQESRKDLESAKKSLQEQDYKWTIIKAYYSMFHAGKSLILSAGYIEKSHDYLIIAVKELFANKGLLPPLKGDRFPKCKNSPRGSIRISIYLKRRPARKKLPGGISGQK